MPLGEKLEESGSGIVHAVVADVQLVDPVQALHEQTTDAALELYAIAPLLTEIEVREVLLRCLV